MSGFGLVHGSQGAPEIDAQIKRLGMALGIDWEDEVQVRELAREALNHSQETLAQYAQHPGDYRLKARVELFGLAAMMMQIMKDSAEENVHTHGGEAWKAFSRALMAEAGL